uniref:glutathione transferase n=1 Tax=Anthurium amnicola TaxID=1678845 RepID=A0A1D1XGT3_9ARAE
MASVKVFGLPACADVARVLACMFEKDVEFQLVRTDNYKVDHKVPEFLKLQDPSGQVTYKDEELTLSDSRKICRRISEKYAKQGEHLLGTGSLERASIEQWLQAEEHSFDAPSSALVFHLAFAPLMNKRERDQEEIDFNKQKLSTVLDIYEDRLGMSKYLAGDDFTLADLSHLPNSHYLVNKTEEGSSLFKSRKNVYRWWNDISSRVSWKKVVELQSEHPGPLEK